jgi:Ca-activated chloride channel family protein
MKIATVAGLSALGMLLTSVSVYSLAPTAGATPPEVAAPETREVVTAQPVAAGDAHFKASATLAMEATLGHASLRAGPSETFVLIEVRGAEGGKATVRAPVNLALVIDRSGSMKGSRIQNAILGATAAVERLHDGDVVSAITFDTTTERVVPPTVIDPGSRARVISAIRGIVLGGDTCISCGIEEGLSALEKTSGRVSRMLVLSDGDATAGVRDVPGFRQLAQRARDKGISITTVGVNVDYNERILGAIAEESNGQHYFVEDAAALSRAFEDEADALTRTIGSGAEVTVDLAPGVELDRVYDRSFRKVDRGVVVPLGTFGKDEVKTVLMKVRVRAEGTPAPVARVDLAYRDLVSGEQARLAGALAARVGEAAELDPVVAARVTRSETAAALTEANGLFATGKVEEARKKLEAQSARVRAAEGKKAPDPFGRAGDAKRDLGGQADILQRAENRFKPSDAPSDPARPFEKSEQGRGAVKDNGKQSFDLRR